MNIMKRYFSKGILAQLGEHLPYKQRVIGSSPIGPIFMNYRYYISDSEWNIIRRSSSVGESTRFIPAVSAVQIRPSLLNNVLQIAAHFFCVIIDTQKNESLLRLDITL